MSQSWQPKFHSEKTQLELLTCQTVWPLIRILTNNIGSKKGDQVKKIWKDSCSRPVWQVTDLWLQGGDCRLRVWDSEKGGTHWCSRSPCSVWTRDIKIAPGLGLVSFHCGMTFPSSDAHCWRKRRCDMKSYLFSFIMYSFNLSLCIDIWIYIYDICTSRLRTENHRVA